MRRAGAHLAWIFLILFAVTIFVIAALLALCGLSFEQSLVFSISALTTTGPLATHWGGANLDYTQLAGSGKLVLMLAMLLGRIETLVALAMLSMRSWGRA